MKETIGCTILCTYLLLGIILWIMGIRGFGGDYSKYLKEECHLSPSFICIIFLVFIISWPLFLRVRKGDE